MELREDGELVERENVDPIDVAEVDVEEDYPSDRLRKREPGLGPVCACEWIGRSRRGG
jgi:hypothetical protein